MDTALLFVLLLVPTYFLPMLVAVARSHCDARAITLLNMVLGWTLVGWVVALVWAATNPKATHPRLDKLLHLLGVDPIR